MAIDRRQSAERRISERVTFTDHLRVRKPGNQHGTAADISATGISIVVPQTIPEGSEVELELFGGTTFVVGKVNKVAPGIRGFRIGIQFNTEQPAVFEKAKGTRR
jgi:hypothetical protein